MNQKIKMGVHPNLRTFGVRSSVPPFMVTIKAAGVPSPGIGAVHRPALLALEQSEVCDRHDGHMTTRKHAGNSEANTQTSYDVIKPGVPWVSVCRRLQASCTLGLKPRHETLPISSKPKCVLVDQLGR